MEVELNISVSWRNCLHLQSCEDVSPLSCWLRPHAAQEVVSIVQIVATRVAHRILHLNVDEGYELWWWNETKCWMSTWLRTLVNFDIKNNKQWVGICYPRVASPWCWPVRAGWSTRWWWRTGGCAWCPVARCRAAGAVVIFVSVTTKGIQLNGIDVPQMAFHRYCWFSWYFHSSR